jgi:hypothetical protein
MTYTRAGEPEEQEMENAHDAQQPGDQAQGRLTTAPSDTDRVHKPDPSFTHVPHPHIARRKQQGPVMIADQLPKQNAIVRFNSRLALLITIGVGSMWCAYLFTGLAFVSLPAAIKSGDTIVLVAWISQTFFQLVLLPIIIVGQNIQGEAADMRAQQTYDDAEAVLHEALQIQQHLIAQDRHLQRQDRRLQEIIDALVRAYPAIIPEGSPPPG